MPTYRNETGRPINVKDEYENTVEVPRQGTFRTLRLYEEDGYVKLSDVPWHRPAKGDVVVLLDRVAVGPGQSLEPTALNLSKVDGYTTAEILVEGDAVVTVTPMASLEEDGFAVPEGAADVVSAKSAGTYISQFGADMAPFLRLRVVNTGGNGFITLKLHVR